MKPWCMVHTKDFICLKLGAEKKDAVVQRKSTRGCCMSLRRGRKSLEEQVFLKRKGSKTQRGIIRVSVRP
jgi:hypothetical protein